MRGDQFDPARPKPDGLIGDVPSSVAALAALLAFIFFAPLLAPPQIDAWISVTFGLSPQRLFLGGAGPGGWFGAIFPLFTHFLLHASLAHLLFNLLWLAVFGAPVARRFRSALRFYLFFTACSIAGGVFFSAFHMNDPTLLVGASGGITGLLGGMVRFAFHRPFTKAVSAKGVLPLTDRSVLTWSAVVIGMNASIAIFGPGVGAGDAEIAWQAHVGGYLFGLVAFPLFDPRLR
ncbi:MAG: rhomboid family intramembrane serine protease [Parvularculaceae bacterium]|nr:rhomboid family intramembrane serine protease [Parvularculaceae bacterium]